MLILNVIVLLLAVGFVMFIGGYYLAKGTIVVKYVPKRKDRKRINRQYEHELRDAINGYKDAEQQYNETNAEMAELMRGLTDE